jgi:hypothetical protein
VRVASPKVSAPLLALSTEPPVLDDNGAITLDRRGRVLLNTPTEPDDRDAGEDLLLQTSPR